MNEFILFWIALDIKLGFSSTLITEAKDVSGLEETKENSV